MPAEPPQLASLGLLHPSWRRDDDLRVLLPEAVSLSNSRPSATLPACVAVLAGSSALKRARAVAAQRDLPCLILDDGLFRAPRIAGRRVPRLSLVAREERSPTSGSMGRVTLTPPAWLLDQEGWSTSDLLARARAAIAALVAAASGTNQSRSRKRR